MCRGASSLEAILCAHRRVIDTDCIEITLHQLGNVFDVETIELALPQLRI